MTLHFPINAATRKLNKVPGKWEKLLNGNFVL